MEGRVEDALLAPHPLLPQHLAVIGGQHDQRAPGLAGRVKPVEQPADMVIDLGDQAQVDRPRRRHVGRRHRGAIAVEAPEKPALRRFAEPGVQEGMIGPRRGGRRQRGGIDEPVVGLGRDQRRMRAQIGDMREPGRPAADVERLDGAAGEIGGVAVLGAVERRVVGARRVAGRADGAKNIGDRPAGAKCEIVALRAQVGRPFQPALEPHLDQFAETRRHALVAQEVGVLGVERGRVRRDVGITEQERLVARLAGLGGQRRVVPRQRRAIAHRAVVHRVKPGQQAGACRPAGHGHGEMPREARAAFGKPGEGRQRHEAGKRPGQHLHRQLIDGDQEDVALRHRRRLRPRPERPGRRGRGRG